MTLRYQNLVKLAIMPVILAFSHPAVMAGERIPPKIELGAIRAHLYYQETGRLSEDILARDPPFIAWNTVIGGGDAQEAADEMLVVLPVTAKGEVFSSEPVYLWVVDSAGKELGRRRFGSVLTSPKGTAFKTLWLEDVTCAGEMVIHAAMRAQARTARLIFHCGE